MGPKRNISYIKPEEPAFIKRMKQAIGYQEPATIETKRDMTEDPEREDEDDREDEKPVVVVLKSGDLTEEEAKQISEKADPTKKIVFSVPAKKSCGLDFSSSSKKDRGELQKRVDSHRQDKVKNASLLSFDDEEEED